MVRNALGDGVTFGWGTPSFTGCIFSGNSGHGIVTPLGASSWTRVTGCVFTGNGDVDVQDGGSIIDGCTFTTGNHLGIDASIPPTISNSQFAGSGQYALRVSAGAAISNLTMNGYTYNQAVLLRDLGEGSVPPLNGGLYYAANSMLTWAPGDDRPLTLQPGVTIKFDPSASLVLGGLWYSPNNGGDGYGCNRGYLVANGTPDAMITLTSLNGSKGGWQGVVFYSCAWPSQMSYCVVENGGAARTFDPKNVGAANIVCDLVGPTISNCVIRNALGPGVKAINANPSISNCAFEANDQAVACVGWPPVPATNNWWGDPSGPTHPSNPDGTGQPVSDNVTFTPWLQCPPPIGPYSLAPFITAPAVGNLWLTGEIASHTVTWTAPSPNVDHVEIFYSPDGGVSWQVLAKTQSGGTLDIPAATGEWSGASLLPAADGTGALVRIELLDVSGHVLGCNISGAFAIGSNASVRLDVQKNNVSQLSAPVIFWNPVPGAATYGINVASDGNTSCANPGGLWSTLVSSPQRWVLFDPSAWQGCPATRCMVTVTAISAEGLPLGQAQTMAFERCKLSDLAPALAEPYSSAPPVLLVHGWLEDQSVWYRCDASPLLSLLTGDPHGQHFHPWALEYPNIQSIAHSAFCLGAAVKYLTTAASGSTSLGIVAHSMGGLVARAYVESRAVDPTDDPLAGVHVGGEGITRLVTLATPHLGEPWTDVDIATLWNTRECPTVLLSGSRRDLSSSGSFIRDLNSHPLPAMPYFFAAGEGNLMSRVAQHSQCPLGGDGAVDICSARGTCGGSFPTTLPTPLPGGSVTNAQYALSHGQMALPGNVVAVCDGDDYNHIQASDSRRLLNDVVGFLRCGQCLTSSSCPADNRRTSRTKVSLAILLGARQHASSGSMGGALPIQGAQVTLHLLGSDPGDGLVATTTDAVGEAALNLVPGVYSRTVGGKGWQAVTDTISVDGTTSELSFAVRLQPDTAYVGPMSPLLTINGGASCCTDSAVTLNLFCAGATQVAVSDGSPAAMPQWMPLQATRTYLLQGGGGAHTLFAVFRDDVGRESDQTSATIVLSQAEGALMVESGGVPGEIAIDGRATGLTTPATVQHLSPGYHTLTVLCDGYRCIPAILSVSVDSGATASAGVTLVASAPPSVPMWLAPTPDAVLSPGAHLAWRSASESDPGGLLAYDVEVFSDSTMRNALWQRVGMFDTTFVVPRLPDSSRCYVAVTSWNNHGVSQSDTPAAQAFRYDATGPTGSVGEPGRGAVLLAGESSALVSSASDWSGVSAMVGVLSVDGRRTFADTIAVGSFRDTVVWAVPDTVADSCWVRVVLSDSAGNSTPLQAVGPFRIVRSLAGVQSGHLPTTIRFAVYPVPTAGRLNLVSELPLSSRVDIMVCDVQGRVVWRHREEGAAPGVHTVVWDGRSTGGSKCPSGVYFAHAVLGQTHFTRRIIVLH